MTLDSGPGALEGAGALEDPTKPLVDVALPLEVGTLVDCRYRDGKYYPARVIERRARAAPGAEGGEEHEYYVHYRRFNRRMDEWVQLDNFALDTVVVLEPIDPTDKARLKRRLEEEHSEEEGEGHKDFDPQQLREHEEFTKVKNIESIELGRFVMETWYFSPLPPAYRECRKLYFCDYDLAFFRKRSQMLRHVRKCRLQHPPGTEIYRSGDIAMYEVDGRKDKTYCQNLCFLAKLFLDHKTLYYDVDLFLFYVMCECDERGAHPVGYFSKEKASEEGFNLACILTFPAFQRRGYGKFLIAFSYELSKVEGRVGTPERPLSDLGLVSYRGFWTRVLLALLREHEGSISITELSNLTMFKPDDIISTLQHLNLIQYQKGQHVICAAPHVIEQRLKQAGTPGLSVDPTKLIFTPYNAERDYARA
ncbi:MOZ/SAS family protein [Helicosporidium sp. ATCC 50920]|nr:MOZ/SAS family protein [Helicosporidium sp. ATCC 50920]|eukprot:KDD73860.1 MOZ/SAS family protein [Helicosporidium sp. ATCC 50920]